MLGGGNIISDPSDLVKGAAMMAKSLMCVQKKLHNPTKDQTILMTSQIACSLICPGLMPSSE
jgi:hypothetical protein